MTYKKGEFGYTSVTMKKKLKNVTIGSEKYAVILPHLLSVIYKRAFVLIRNIHRTTDVLVLESKQLDLTLTTYTVTMDLV